MRINQYVGKLLLLGVIVLTACSGTIDPADLEALEASENSLSAAEINAAAERPATTEPASQPTETLPPETSATETSPLPTDEPTPIPTEEGPRTNPRVEVPEDLFVNWLIPWDGIRPVYDPIFASADDAPLDDNELIIGISLENEAKAYPISVLGHREMVNDKLAGIPTLVTW